MLCFWLLLAILSYTSACKPKSDPDKTTTPTTTENKDSLAANAESSLASNVGDSSTTTTSTLSGDNTALATTDTASSDVAGITKTGAVLPSSNSNIKWGYLNSLELLALMPETKQADQKLEELQRSKESAFKSLMDKYQKGAQELQEKGQDMTRIEQESKMKEMGDLENRLSQMQANSGEEIAIEKEKLYAPILKKADKYIKQVGKEQGYEFVLDATSLLYADESRNLLPAVKKKMGLK